LIAGEGSARTDRRGERLGIDEVGVQADVLGDGLQKVTVERIFVGERKATIGIGCNVATTGRQPTGDISQMNTGVLAFQLIVTPVTDLFLDNTGEVGEALTSGVLRFLAQQDDAREGGCAHALPTRQDVPLL
jgi:hypothetical protein